MDWHNNDPAGVKALLEQLRTSQAWLDVVNSSTTNVNDAVHLQTAHVTSTTQPETHASLANGDPASVAALLSQLQASPSESGVATPSASSPLPKNARREKSQDLKSLTFQQALPHLVRRSEDPKFRLAILEMQQEQAELERRLWGERRAIQRKHEEAVNITRTKAVMIGVGITKHEADAMAENFRRELRKFDRERALPAWDGLLTKQQSALFDLGVPTMFVTNLKADRERQQRVMQVLEGMES